MKQVRKGKLPVFEYEFDEQDLLETFGIALVKTPAIQKTFAAFKRAVGLRRARNLTELSGTFKPTGQRQILLGALAIPAQPIYRRDTRGEYIVRFTESNIKTLYDYLSARVRSAEPVRFNLEHKSTVAVEAELKNVFLKQPGDLLDALGYEDYPNGTLFISVYVPDVEVWERYVLPKKVVGFSLEMHAGLKATNDYLERKNRYDVVPTKLTQNKEDMNTLKRVLSLFSGVKTADDVARIAKSELEKLAASEMMLADGRTLIVEEDGTVYLRSTDESGDEVIEIAPAGEHTLADGTIVRLTYTIDVVEPVEAPDPEEVAAPNTEVAELREQVAELRKQLAELSRVRLNASKPRVAAVPNSDSAPAQNGIVVSDLEFLNRNKRNAKNR